MARRFRVGQRVRVVKIVDDFKCVHVGQIGEVTSDTEVSFVTGEAIYEVRFDDGTGHRFFKSELEGVEEATHGSV